MAQQEIKYQGSEVGQQWTGRGRPPTWVTDYLANGVSLDDIRVGVKAPKHQPKKEPVIETITYEEFQTRIKSADITLEITEYDPEDEHNKDALGGIGIKADGIDIDINVWIGHEWNQGRFYDLQEVFVKKCHTVIDDDGEVLNLERHYSSEIRDLVAEKAYELIRAWFVEHHDLYD